MKILLATDGSFHASAAIDAVLARYWAAHNQVHVVCVADGLNCSSGKLDLDAARIIVRDAVWALRTRFRHDAVTGIAQEGDPPTVVMKVADSWRPDLIAVGYHGHQGSGRSLPGAVTDFVVNHAACSVLVARTGAHLSENLYERTVIIGVSLSSNAKIVLDWVAGQQWVNGTKFILVHVVHPPDKADMGSEVAQDKAKSTKIPAELMAENAAVYLRLRFEHDVYPKLLYEADLPAAILKISRECGADLVILGARSDRASKQITLSRTARTMLAHADCSIQLIRLGTESAVSSLWAGKTSI